MPFQRYRQSQEEFLIRLPLYLQEDMSKEGQHMLLIGLRVDLNGANVAAVRDDPFFFGLTGRKDKSATAALLIKSGIAYNYYYLNVLCSSERPVNMMSFDNNQRSLRGTVALVGSGEYLPVMDEIDTYLLNTLEGAQSARIALLPTASGLELMGPRFWNDLGLQHFKQLGVSDIRATRIVDNKSANDPAQVALLEEANFFYFSGGNPQYIIDTLRDSLAWQSIQTAYEQGAVLAGCSAGAMMLGGYTASLRQAIMGNNPEFVTALGIVPYLIVFPHFDRMAANLDQERFQQWLKAIPKGYVIAGIDEDTALIRVEHHADGSKQDRWRVMGRQTVQVFTNDGHHFALRNGEEILF